MRLIIGSGIAESDLFDLDPPNRPLPLHKALMAAAVDYRGPSKGGDAYIQYDVVLGIDITSKDKAILFAQGDNRSEKRWKNLTQQKTQASSRIASVEQRDKSLSVPGSAASTSNQKRAGTVQQTEELGDARRGFRNLTGQLNRAWQSDQSVLAVLLHPEELWIGQPNDAELELLRELGNVVRSQPGHAQSRIICIVKPACREAFINYLNHMVNLSGLYHEQSVPLPDKDELRDYIEERRDCDELYGDANEVADIIVQRKLPLYALVDAIDRLIKLEKEDRRLDRLLESGEREDQHSVWDELDALVGLADVKAKFKEFAKLAETRKNDRIHGRRSSAAISTHMIFMGPPGTGKTEVAGLMARYLHALGLRSAGEPVSISASDIHSAYNPGDVVARMREAIDRATGGVLFIDEAYQFAEDKWLKQAFETLLTAMEERRDTLTVILAGYEDRMQELLNVNAGLRSRFPRNNWFYFRDYSADELEKIAELMLRRRHLELHADTGPAIRSWIETEICHGRMDNARGVRNLTDQILINRASTGCTGSVIRCEQVPAVATPNYDAFDKRVAMLRDRYVGCESLFAYLGALRDEVECSAVGSADPPVLPALRFVGPPGVGKTSLAREFGELLQCLAIVSRGHTHEVSALADLCGNSEERSGERLDRAFELARGGVLFIDEAYQLNGVAGGSEIVNLITQRMTSTPFHDTVVILAGYVTEMRELMRMNPGLQSRFPKEIEFVCPDNGQLEKIVMNELDRQYLSVETRNQEDMKKAVISRLQELRCVPEFAGARTACQLANEIRQHQNKRIVRLGEAGKNFHVLPEDVCGERKNLKEATRLAIREFNEEFVGLESVREELERIVALIRLRSRRVDADAGIAPRLLFAGPPGTGKTTVARKLGVLLHALGVLPRSDVVEETGAGIQAGYVGQTPERVRALFRSARGGVLFIDEIYGLADGEGGTDSGGSFKREAINELVAQLTAPENRRTCVVAAGYSERMNSFLLRNPGLQSRFYRTIVFPPLSSDNALTLAWRYIEERLLSGNKMRVKTLRNEAGDDLRKVVSHMCKQDRFGNARSIGGLVDEIEMELAVRLYRDSDADDQLCAEDIRCVCNRFMDRE